MNVPSLMAFLLTLLLSARPIGHTWDPGCQESDDQYAVRVYRHIDTAAANVYSIHEPPLHSGPWALEETLVRMLAISHHESGGFCRAVDEGMRTGDHGASVCACGIMTVGGKADDYTRAELLADLGPCYLVGLHRLQKSWLRCTAFPYGRIRTYASGSCIPSRAAKDIYDIGNAWWHRTLQAWKDGKIR